MRQRQSYKFKKIDKTLNFWILKKSLHVTHLLKLLNKKCKHKMDPASIVEDTVYPKKYAHGFCFAVLCCGYTLTDFLTIAPVPAKQPWLIWINTSCEFIMNDCITTTKQSTTKPCAYFLGYTVQGWHNSVHRQTDEQMDRGTRWSQYTPFNFIEWGV